MVVFPTLKTLITYDLEILKNGQLTSLPLRLLGKPILNLLAMETGLFSGQNCCALHNLLPEANVVPLLMQVFCEDASQFPLYYLAGGQCGLLLHAIARSNRTIAELRNLPLSKQWHW